MSLNSFVFLSFQLLHLSLSTDTQYALLPVRWLHFCAGISGHVFNFLKKPDVITNCSIMVAHSEMESHSIRFAEESATSKQKNKMQKQTGIQADMRADWWGWAGAWKSSPVLQRTNK